MSGFERSDQRPGGHEGPLDRAAQLPRHVSEGIQLLHVLGHAAHVHRVERVLRVQHLQI